MEVQPPDLSSRLIIWSSLNLSILTIIQLYIDFSEGIELGDRFISDIIINLILLTHICISYFFGNKISFVKRFILLAMLGFLFLSYFISGCLCRYPLSISSLIGIYNFTLFMRIPLLVLHFNYIEIYMFEEF